MSAEEVRRPHSTPVRYHDTETHGHGMTKRAQTTKHDRRSSEPVALLSRDFDAVCSVASDPLEITAALEASGWSDVRAQTELGRPDVFVVADELFKMVPRKLKRTSSPDPVTIITRFRQLLHGALYVVPGIVTLVLAPNLLGRSNNVLLLLALIYGWATGHALSFLGHTCLAQGDLRTAKRVLRTGSLVLIVAWMAFTELLVLTGRSSESAALFGILQVVYFLASTAMQVLKRELLLLICLVPAFVAVALSFLEIERYSAPSLLLSVALAVGAAVFATRGPGSFNRETLDWSDLRDALPYFVYGVLCAVFVVVASLDWKVGAPVYRQAVADLVGLPLILSMAASEWQLHGFRHRCSEALIVSPSMVAFQELSREAFSTSVRRYLAVVALISGAVMCVLISRNDFLVVDLLRMIGFGLLGGAFYVALALVSFGYVRAVVISGAAALGLMEIARVVFRVEHASGGLFMTFGLAAAIWFTTLLVMARRNLVNVLGHR